MTKRERRHLEERIAEADLAFQMRAIEKRHQDRLQGRRKRPAPVKKETKQVTGGYGGGTETNRRRH